MKKESNEGKAPYYQQILNIVFSGDQQYPQQNEAQFWHQIFKRYGDLLLETSIPNFSLVEITSQVTPNLMLEKSAKQVVLPLKVYAENPHGKEINGRDSFQWAKLYSEMWCANFLDEMVNCSNGSSYPNMFSLSPEFPTTKQPQIIIFATQEWISKFLNKPFTGWVLEGPVTFVSWKAFEKGKLDTFASLLDNIKHEFVLHGLLHSGNAFRMRQILNSSFPNIIEWDPISGRQSGTEIQDDRPYLPANADMLSIQLRQQQDFLSDIVRKRSLGIKLDQVSLYGKNGYFIYNVLYNAFWMWVRHNQSSDTPEWDFSYDRIDCILAQTEFILHWLDKESSITNLDELFLANNWNDFLNLWRDGGEINFLITYLAAITTSKILGETLSLAIYRTQQDLSRTCLLTSILPQGSQAERVVFEILNATQPSSPPSPQPTHPNLLQDLQSEVKSYFHDCLKPFYENLPDLFNRRQRIKIRK